jgi:hypothetical protein
MLTRVQPRTYAKPPPVALQARYRGRHHQLVSANVSDGHRCLLCSLRQFQYGRNGTSSPFVADFWYPCGSRHRPHLGVHA